MEPTAPKQSFIIPIAIIFGFGLIAVAIYFSGGRAPATAQLPNNAEPVQQQVSGKMKPITGDDYIRGNPNAPIMLVEYSDYDCPFCKTFHETMRQVMAEYGTTGEVGWVYRHFPLAQLHPNAPLIAEASECVAELAGKDAFWKFTDLVFDEREVNAQTNVTRLEEFAVSAGADKGDFVECMESERNRSKVEEDLRDAVESGGTGTPHTVVVVGDQQAPIKGAQPYDVVRDIIENLLTQISGGEVEAADAAPSEGSEQ